MNRESENLATRIYAHGAGSLSLVNSLLAAFGINSKIGRAVDHPHVLHIEAVVESLPVVPAAAVEPSDAAHRVIEAEIRPARGKRKRLSQESLNAIGSYLVERAELLNRALSAVHGSQARTVQWHIDRTARLRSLLGFRE